MKKIYWFLKEHKAILIASAILAAWTIIVFAVIIGGGERADREFKAAAEAGLIP